MRSSKTCAGIEVDGEVWGRIKLELPGELIAIRKLFGPQNGALHQDRFGDTTIPLRFYMGGFFNRNFTGRYGISFL
jgi:hypothetical protein